MLITVHLQPNSITLEKKKREKKHEGSGDARKRERLEIIKKGKEVR